MASKEVVVEGLRKGVGSTVGNFVRRMILASDNSIKVIAVRINKGEVESMFVPIDNVVQDSMDVVNNLTEIQIEGGLEEGFITKLYVEIGGGVLTAGMFAQKGLKINNPEHEILTTIGEQSVSAELIVKHGYGYVSSEKNRIDCQLEFDESELKDFIFLDSYHSQAQAHFNCEEMPDGTETVKVVVETVQDDVDGFVSKTMQEAMEVLKNFK